MVKNITQEFLDLIKLPNPNAKKLNYLFVMPRFVMNDDETYIMPIGLCYVSSALKASGRNVLTLNLNYKAEPYVLLRQIIVDNSIDVVLTGGLSGQFSLLKELIDSAKNANPNVITCVGGGIITADPVVAMKALGTVDYGIIGEGEITINSLAYALENNENVRDVDGVILPNVQVYKSRPEIQNLDILPFPDYNGFEYGMLLRDGLLLRQDLRGKTAFIVTGRSCPCKCTFCFRSSGQKYRRRSIENVILEIDWIISNYSIEYFYFLDELFINDIDFVKAITSYVKKLNIGYWVQSRVDMVTKEILQILKKSGCYQIFYGIESADNHILKSMKKNITVDQINKALDWTMDVGLETRGNIIFGDPEETFETINHTLKWWKRQKQISIQLIWIMTFPGSHLYKIACDSGVIKDRVKYLIDNDFQINLTKMPNEQYWEMVKKVALFQILLTNGMDFEFNDMIGVENIISKNLEYLLKGQKIAIWPATIDIITMLNGILPGFVDNDNVLLVNINPNDLFNIGNSRCRKIYSPDEVFSSYYIDIVLFAFGGERSIRVYNEINEMIIQRYKNIKHIIKLSELTASNFKEKY